MKTYSEARARLRWYQSRHINFDNWCGYQCTGLAVDYIYWLLEVRMWGNAKDAINNDFKDIAAVYEDTPSSVPQVGNMAVFTRGIYKQYSHTSLVSNGGNTNQSLTSEQNYDGNANTPAKLRWDNCYGCTHFIRPRYKNEGLMNKITNKVKPPAQKTIDESTSKITVGNKASYSLKWSKGAYFNAKIDGLGVTSTIRYGDNRTNYGFDVGQAMYTPGTLVYVFETIGGWCRIYQDNHNEWVWHERLIVKEMF